MFLVTDDIHILILRFFLAIYFQNNQRRKTSDGFCLFYLFCVCVCVTDSNHTVLVFLEHKNAN